MNASDPQDYSTRDPGDGLSPEGTLAEIGVIINPLAWYTVDDVQAVFGVSRLAVVRHTRRKTLRSVMLGNKRFYAGAWIIAWLHSLAEGGPK